MATPDHEIKTEAMTHPFIALDFSATRADALIGQVQAALGNGARAVNTALVLADEACGQALIDAVADWLRQELGSASVLPLPVMGREGAQARIQLLLSHQDAAPRAFGPLNDWSFDAVFGALHQTLPGLCLASVDPRMPFTPQRLQLMQEGSGAYLCGAIGAPSGTYAGPRGLHFSAETLAISHTFAGLERLAGDHRITAAEGQVIHEIDGRPALEVLKAVAGDILGRKPEQIPKFLFAAFPVSHADPGDFLARRINGMGAHSGAISVEDEVLPGMPLAFARRNGAYAKSRLEAGIAHALERFGAAPAGALYLHDQRRADDFREGEVPLVRGLLGQTPLIAGQVQGLVSHNRYYTFASQLILFG